MYSYSDDLQEKITQTVQRHADTLRRICFVYLHNRADVEDVFQEVLLTLLTKAPEFESPAHERAWLCRVAINKCKDICKSYWRKHVTSLDVVREEAAPELSHEDEDVLAAVMSLPTKYKDVVYLHFYEGYSEGEIAKLLSERPNTIYSRIHRAKALLRQTLRGDEHA